MIDWFSVAVRAGLPVAVALAGGLVGVLGGRRSQTTASLVVHFAAGAFLALVAVHLLPEAGEQAGWPGAVMATAVGWSLCAAISRRVGATCPGCTVGHTHPGQLAYGPALLAVVAVHSTLDGLALAGADLHGRTGELLSLAVLTHKLPEGMAVAAVCRTAGRSTAQALGLTALVQSGTVLGFLAGLLLFRVNETVLGLGLGLVSGSLVYLAALTLRADREARRQKGSLLMAAGGAVLVLVVHLATGGRH